MSLRILNLADIVASPNALDALAQVGEIITRPARREVLLEELRSCDAYVASLHVQLDRKALQSAPRLKFIATPSTGLDHIDLTVATEQGIEVLSLRELPELLDSITATAEMTWALLLAVVRQLPWSFAAATRGHWARDEFRGHQLSGQTLGICGYGRLGKMVAEYGRAFRMRVLVCDTNEIEVPEGIHRVDLETLLAQSDVLSIHIHLNEANRGLFGCNQLRAMKRGAILLNTSRGAIVDEAALLETLESGYLGGAGLDVIDGEWNADLASHPLLAYARTHRNLVVSPHTGGVTFESQQQVYEHIAAKLAARLREVIGA